jgi:membrane protein YqaA with SNARE-associated domain
MNLLLSNVMRAGLVAFIASGSFKWLFRLGGPGLILLGLADNSFIPLPGSMDVLTIVLAASHREWWWYYSLMATLGAVAGGYLTYRIGSKGGKEALERKLLKDKAEKVYQKFEKGGFWAVAIPAILPPPVPIVPFLLAAGALQYSRRKFIAALAVGRGVRFMIVGFVAAHFGTQIFRFFSRYYKPALYVLVALAVAGGLTGVFLYARHRKHRPARSNHANGSGKRVRSRRKVA